jgi:hypothetical protein
LIDRLASVCWNYRGYGGLSAPTDVRSSIHVEDSMRTMNLELVGPTLITTLGRHAPSDGDCRQWLAVISEHVRVATGVVVYTQGGLPNGRQRRSIALMRRVLTPHFPPIAVVSPLLTVRAVVTILACAHDERVRAFEPAVFNEALRYLGAPVADTQRIRDAVARLVTEREQPERVWWARPRSEGSVDREPHPVRERHDRGLHATTNRARREKDDAARECDGADTEQDAIDGAELILLVAPGRHVGDAESLR